MGGHNHKPLHDHHNHREGCAEHVHLDHEQSLLDHVNVRFALEHDHDSGLDGHLVHFHEEDDLKVDHNDKLDELRAGYVLRRFDDN